MTDSRPGSTQGRSGDEPAPEGDRPDPQRLLAWKTEAVARMAGGMGHDLRNQLTVIKGYCDLLLGQLPPDSDVRDSVEHIRSAADRATALTGQLLAFGRARTLRPETFDLNHAVEEMCGSLRRMMGQGIALSFLPDPQPCPVHVDRAVLAEALVNMAVNAREAMPGGGDLTIQTSSSAPADTVLPVEGLEPGRCVTLSMADTGVGMDEPTRRQAFEPFFTTKPSGRGTGLGLSTVWAFVTGSGGHVDVTSRCGLGTTFTIYLPRASEPVGQAPPRAGGETILLVEDEEGVRRLLVDLLGREGYHVLAAPGGPEALAAAGEHAGPIQVLLTDVVMPHLSGTELARRLKAERPEMEVLFMTGYADDVAEPSELAELGAAVLPKPFGPEALTRAVRDVLDQRR